MTNKVFGKLSDDNLEKDGDRLGGGGPVDSGAYPATVKLAFVRNSQSSNAMGIEVHLDIGGRDHRETLWVTNRNGENFFQDKRDPSKKRPLPGYTMADDLALLTTGQELKELEAEEKVVNLYDFDKKTEVPTNVMMFTSMLGKPVIAGLIRETVDRQQKNDAGTYVNTGETRDQNSLDKLFHHELKVTVTEAREEISEPVFYPLWVEKNTGKTRDKAKGAANGSAPGRPQAANAGGAPSGGSGQAPKKSLFG